MSLWTKFVDWLKKDDPDLVAQVNAIIAKEEPRVKEIVAEIKAEAEKIDEIVDAKVDEVVTKVKKPRKPRAKKTN